MHIQVDSILSNHRGNTVIQNIVIGYIFSKIMFKTYKIYLFFIITSSHAVLFQRIFLEKRVWSNKIEKINSANTLVECAAICLVNKVI